jgi:hypothetical protein
MMSRNFFHRLFRGHWFKSEPDESPEVQQAWSLSARLAAIPYLYTKIVPSDLADLIKEAKMLHPEVAHHADRRDEAMRVWAARAKQREST